MKPRPRRIRWRVAAASVGGLLLSLATGLSLVRAEEPPPLLHNNTEALAETHPSAQDPKTAPKLPAAFHRQPKGKKQSARASRGTQRLTLQLANLKPPPEPSDIRLQWQKPDGPGAQPESHPAHAPPPDFDSQTGPAADARLLFLYPLVPEPDAAWLPNPSFNIFAEEDSSRADASEALLRFQADSSGPEGRTSRLRLLGEDEHLLSLSSSASPMETLAPASRPQLLFLDVEQRRGNSRYGAAYRYHGPDRRSTRKYGGWVQSDVKWRRDQESLETWYAQRFGDTRLKFFLAEFQNNVEQDPGRHSIESLKTGVSASQRLDGTPLYLSLSVSQGTSSAGREPRGREPFSSRSWNTYNAALSYYPDSRWDAYISSGYSSAGDLTQTGDAGDFQWHEVGLSIHPTWATVLKPTVAMGKIRSERTGDEIDYPFASLSLTFYDLLPPFEVTLWSSYARMTSNEANVDATSADASLRLSRQLPMAPAKGTLSLELGWSSYQDHLSPDRSYEGATGMATLRFAF